METTERVVYVDADSVAAALLTAAHESNALTLKLQVERRDGETFQVRYTERMSERKPKERRFSQREMWEWEHQNLRVERGEVDDRLRQIDARLAQLDELLGGYSPRYATEEGNE